MSYIKNLNTLSEDSRAFSNFSNNLIVLLKAINNPSKDHYDSNVSKAFFDLNLFLATYVANHSDFDYFTAYHNFIANPENFNLNAYHFSDFCKNNLTNYIKNRPQETSDVSI